MSRSTQLGLAFPKLKPSAERVLEMLKAAGPRGVTSAEFANNYVLRFSARVKELRDLGMLIRTERIPGRSQARYTLCG